MTAEESTVKRETERFLRTGKYDPVFRNWPGDNVFEKATTGSSILKETLLAEVKSKEAGGGVQGSIQDEVRTAPDLLRRILSPMVKGLFPAQERDVVLDRLEKSVVFLSPENIAFLHTYRGFRLSPWCVCTRLVLPSG